MLVFSFIGMKSVEKDVTPGKRIVVRMEEDVTGIEEVVITGIYSRDKNSYTGSATTYSAQELKMVGAQNVIQSLKTLDPAMPVSYTHLCIYPSPFPARGGFGEALVHVSGRQ